MNTKTLTKYLSSVRRKLITFKDPWDSIHKTALPRPFQTNHQECCSSWDIVIIYLQATHLFYPTTRLIAVIRKNKDINPSTTYCIINIWLIADFKKSTNTYQVVVCTILMFHYKLGVPKNYNDAALSISGKLQFPKKKSISSIMVSSQNYLSTKVHHLHFLSIWFKTDSNRFLSDLYYLPKFMCISNSIIFKTFCLFFTKSPNGNFFK